MLCNYLMRGNRRIRERNTATPAIGATIRNVTFLIHYDLSSFAPRKVVQVI